MTESDTPTMYRRTILATGATAGVALSGGCLDWLWPGDDESAGSDNSGSAGGTDQQDNRSTENDSRGQDQDQDRHEDEDRQNDTENDTDTDESEETQSNETEEGEEPEVHNESELHPDENETQHTGEYNESGGMRETEPRTRDGVEITDESATMNDRGGVTMTATVTNTSNEPIDAIDIYVDYTVRGEYVYGDSVVVRGLGAGASEQIESTAPPGRVGGANPDEMRVEIVEVKPYDYASSGE